MFTGLPHTGPGLAEVECVEHHRLVTLCNLKSSQSKTEKSKSIENNVSQEWNEEFVFHVNDATHDLVITLLNHDSPTRDYVIGECTEKCALNLPMKSKSMKKI